MKQAVTNNIMPESVIDVCAQKATFEFLWPAEPAELDFGFRA
jgi:hypothetical protein